MAEPLAALDNILDVANNIASTYKSRVQSGEFGEEEEEEEAKKQVLDHWSPLKYAFEASRMPSSYMHEGPLPGRPADGVPSP